MKTIQLDLFSFNELSDEAKAKAIESERNSENLEYHYSGEVEYYQDVLKNIGFTNVEISFSGFYSQGDGASFTADYDSSLINLDELKNHNTELYSLMARIDSVFGASGLTSDNVITANVKRISRHYSHHNTVALDDIAINGCGWGDDESDKINIAYNDLENYLTSLKDDICYIIYNSLEREYDYQSSDDYIAELLTINDYYFLADGTFYQ